MKDLEITIPVKPLSINSAYKVQRFASDDLKQFEKDACNFVRISNNPIDYECELHFTFYIKNYKRTDTSNLIKVAEDFLVKRGIIKDDSLVVYLTAKKVYNEEEKIVALIKKYESK